VGILPLPLPFVVAIVYVPKKINFRRRTNPMADKVLQAQIEKGVLRVLPVKPLSTNRWHLVRKTRFPEDDPRGWRLVVDMACNPFVVSGSFPLKNPETVAKSGSQHLYHYVSDADTAYAQFKWASLADESHTALLTGLSVLSHTGMPQGLKGSQEFLMRGFTQIFSVLENPPTIYVDNFNGGADSEPEMFARFSKFLAVCHRRNVKLNVADTEVGALVIETLGYVIRKGSYSPGERLTRAIAKMPAPRDVKELKSFLASCNVMRAHIPSYNALTSALTSLVRKNVVWSWTIEQEQAFGKLKRAMIDPAVLMPFSQAAPARLFTDYNGFIDQTGVVTRRPAVGGSLWQEDAQGVWRPIGYASRFISVAEKNLITKQSAFSSMIGESIAFHFAMVYFYPELVCLPNGFEVIADCRNLTYWKTSDSPVLASLRASLSGRFDLSKVRLRHINRVHNFTADSLARLSTTEPNPNFLEIMCSVYEFPQLAEIILDSGPSCSVTEVPDSFSPADFSPAEIEHLKTDKTSHVVGGQPVTRQLHGHPVFVMPLSKVRETFLSAHVTDEGPHLSAEATRANLAHLHWSGKAGSGANSFRALMWACTVCQQNAAVPRYKTLGHAGARPTAFGELVFFDHKSFVQMGGTKLILGTSMDKAT
jgi:hypothetical protein